MKEWDFVDLSLQEARRSSEAGSESFSAWQYSLRWAIRPIGHPVDKMGVVETPEPVFGLVGMIWGEENHTEGTVEQGTMIDLSILGLRYKDGLEEVLAT